MCRVKPGGGLALRREGKWTQFSTLAENLSAAGTWREGDIIFLPVESDLGIPTTFQSRPHIQ